jgi:hypothetical protein
MNPMRVLLPVLLVVLLLTAVVPVYSQPVTQPSVILRMDPSIIEPGQTFHLGLSLRNPGADFPADFYVGLLLPDHVTLVFFTSFTPLAAVVTRLDASPATFAPLVANGVLRRGLDSHVDDLLVFTIPETATLGVYTFFAFFTVPGALSDGRMDSNDIRALNVGHMDIRPQGKGTRPTKR